MPETRRVSPWRLPAWVAAATLLVACGAEPVQRAEPPAPPAPRVLLEPQPLLLEGQCDLEDNDLTIDRSNDAVEEAPVIRLEEHLIGAGSTPAVTLAMWADGYVIFSHGWRDDESPTLETRIDPAEVERVRQLLLTKLEGLPPHDQLGWADPATGKETSYSAHDQLVRIFVRNGASWRIAFVWGLTREDALSPPAPTPQTGAGIAADAGWKDTWVKEQPSPKLVDAYLTLLAARPRTGEPRVPYTYNLTAYAAVPGKADVLGWPTGPAIAWPPELPVPPPTPPGVCAPTRDGNGGCLFRIPAADAADAHPFVTSYRTTTPHRLLAWQDMEWNLVFRPYLRGDDTIHRIRNCAREELWQPGIQGDVFH